MKGEKEKPLFPKRKILFVTSELAPYSATGGLGEVSRSLPIALRLLGHDVRILTPLYGTISTQKHNIHPINRLQSIGIPFSGSLYPYDIYSTAILTPETRTEVYFAKSAELFDRPGLYTDPLTGSDYPDNAHRYGSFSFLSLEFCRRLQWIPDIIHVHDWATSYVSEIVASHRLHDRSLSHVRSILTVHNGGYPGPISDGISYLEHGRRSSDGIVYVSPTYYAETSDSLDKVKGVGILNGIDYREWNPAHDANLHTPFSVDNLSGKESCRADLLQSFDMPVEKSSGVIGIVSRLVDQKGIDLIVDVLEHLRKEKMLVVVLGQGEKKYEEYLKHYEKKYPDWIGVHIGYNANLAHKIIGGADMILMPSKYEPCGLTQMYAMRYGTIPIVRRTGGLADTVVDPLDATKKKTATGFVFDKYDVKAFTKAIDRALTMFRKHPDKWKELQYNGMTRDFSWNESAKKYCEFYEKILKKKI